MFLLGGSGKFIPQTVLALRAVTVLAEFLGSPTFAPAGAAGELPASGASPQLSQPGQPRKPASQPG